jgi:hypothetical protein
VPQDPQHNSGQHALWEKQCGRRVAQPPTLRPLRAGKRRIAASSGRPPAGGRATSSTVVQTHVSYSKPAVGGGIASDGLVDSERAVRHASGHDTALLH